MSRFLPYLWGPELYWVLICGVVHGVTRRHLPPTESLTRSFDLWVWVIPFLLVPLTFACFFVGGTGRGWLLLRVNLAIAVGLFVAAVSLGNGMTYHQPSAGPGAGTAFIVMLIFGYGMAMVGTVVTALILAFRAGGWFS
ncbi:MAG TPA: hypothetical protein PLN52_07975 [Opitutaceae bacterium]|nr:hypothetical protein [Opitutaceae bacterium]